MFKVHEPKDRIQQRADGSEGASYRNKTAIWFDQSTDPRSSLLTALHEAQLRSVDLGRHGDAVAHVPLLKLLSAAVNGFFQIS